MMFSNAIMSDNYLGLGDMIMTEDLMVVQSEALPTTSNEEANKVFAQWKADDNIEELMEIDEQIGSNLLDDSLFDESCLSPTGPLEELSYNMNVESGEEERYLLPTLEGVRAAPAPLQPKPTFLHQSKAMEEQYQSSLRKLAESMRRSQETRRSLTLKTPKTKKYARSKDVNGVLNSVEQSSRQLQQLYLPRNM